MRKLTQTDVEILKGYAECDMNIQSTGKRLHYGHGTVSYHLKRIEQKTGLNPRRFFDLVKLLEMVE